jgi:hypothetical protein
MRMMVFRRWGRREFGIKGPVLAPAHCSVDSMRQVRVKPRIDPAPGYQQAADLVQSTVRCRDGCGTSGLLWRLAIRPNQGELPMSKILPATALALATILAPVSSFAQNTGAGTAAGSGSAVGTPSAGSAGAGTTGVSGIPSGPGSVGGVNNSVNDPSGIGNASKVPPPPPPSTSPTGR